MLTKVIVSSLSLILVGCASTSSRQASDDNVAAAMMCPKCETVWVARVTDQGLKSQRLVSEKKMVCPHCDEMAQAYLKDGKTVLHDCPDCKVTLTPVKPARPSSPKGPRPS